MTLVEGLLLGALQGLTEFLPVSSSGHLALAQQLMPGFEQPGLLFDVALHLGTLVAVILYFRQDLKQLLTAPFRRDIQAVQERRYLRLLIIGSIPTAIIGLTLKDTVEELFHRPVIVAALLLATGLLLFVAERFRSSGRKRLTLADSLITGLAQGVAVLPGVSRSGATIAALLLRGVDGQTAARFSFLLALPAVGGAALVSLKDVEQLPQGEIGIYLAGAGIACLVGLICIHALLGIIRQKRLYYFSLYCWLVGGAALYYFQ
jgi:undecaprenyl-diphosphatase